MESVADLLKGRKGISDAFEMDDRLRDMVTFEERGVTTTSGMALENRALDECIKRDRCVCLILSGGFEPELGHLVTMEDTKGRTVGFDVPESMRAEFSKREDVVWLSDDFALLMDAEINQDTKTVLHPHNVKCLDDIEKMRDPILFYPSTTTDILLKRELGIKSLRGSTAILAFNWV